MTIDEVIKHSEEVAEEHERHLKVYENMDEDRPLFREEENECKDCAEEHRQLAGWLKELKQLRKQTKKGHWMVTAEEYYKAINEKGGGVNENTDYFVDDIACSECLAKFSVIDNETERFDFCPNCGAEMEGE